MSTFLFPDVNVWIALSDDVHPHHQAALAWFGSLHAMDRLCFCRQTQLGLLRLLTNRSAMGPEVRTQAGAWAVYDTFDQSSSVRLVEEPEDLEAAFRAKTDRDEISTKQWADGYLAAFAETYSFTLVTFDHALAKATHRSVLLQADGQVSSRL